MFQPPHTSDPDKRFTARPAAEPEPVYTAFRRQMMLDHWLGMGGEMIYLRVSVPVSMWRAIQHIASEVGVKRTEVIRSALAQVLSEEIEAQTAAIKREITEQTFIQP